MPALPMAQRHETPKRGDSKNAIHRAAGHAFDANTQGPYWMHWPTPAKNGYTRIRMANGKTRRMTLAERRRPWTRWTEAGVLSWRRPNGERPMRDLEALELCAQVGALPIRDVKYPGAGSDARWFELYVRNSKAAGVPAWFKALPTMAGFRGKFTLCRAAGGQLVAIWGNFTRGRKRRLARTARLTKSWPAKPGTW